MKKKFWKLAALVLAIALLVGLCLFANSLVGNPISRLLATRTAKRYIQENHPGMDYQLDSVNFNFKFICYNAHFSAPSSPDSSFSLMLGMDGRLIQSHYTSSVTDRGNTARRLEDEYRAAVASVLDSPLFPYHTHINYGQLHFISAEYKNAPGVPPYALVSNDLELDKTYDINALGAQAGKLTIYLYDDTVTTHRLAQILLDIKGRMDAAGVSFYIIDCVLEYPKQADGQQKEGRVEVMDFLCADIYEDGLPARVQASNDAARAYYDEMDAQKDQP